MKGKIAIVTGASRGLGKAVALGFAREGADVVVAARTEVENPDYPGSIHRTAEEIKAIGRQSLAVKCDVTSEESVAAMVKQALERFGRIDILVNNAGVAFSVPILDTSLKRFELVYRVNVIGTLICVKAVMPTMIAQRSGSIINISSRSADERCVGEIATGLAYGTAKAALERLTYGIAAEFGKYNVAVNAIKPVRVVDTEGMRFWAKDADKSGWQSPEKMVKCIIMMAKQDARGITGNVCTDDEFSEWHGIV